MLLILYYTLATLIRLWLQEPIDQMTVSVQMSDDGRRFHFRRRCDVCCKINQPLGYFTLADIR